MCGRYTLHTSMQVIANLFEVKASTQFAPSYNVAPTQEVPVVRLNDEGRRELTMMRWGLVPFWAKDSKIGASLINARAETLNTKPAFRSAFERRRCLVVADGFFEWKKTAHNKQPYWIHFKSNEPFAFAGLFERWGVGEQQITSCTIITTTPNDLIADLHDRMPVILPRAVYDHWLDSSCNDPRSLSNLLLPIDPALMAAHPVSKVVNSAKTDSPACIEPLQEQPQLIIRKLV